LVIPAWSFARGNVRIHTNPDEYADAGPVVVGGDEMPWGYMVEYDIDVPVTGVYYLHICHASAEARPVEVFFEGKNQGKCCLHVTSGSAATQEPNGSTFNSSGAKWEGLQHPSYGKWSFVKLSASQGKRTLKLTRRGPLPHLVALRLDTAEEFPEDWRPPQYTVRDIESIPEQHRAAFLPGDGIHIARLRSAVEDTIKTFGPRYPEGPKALEQLAELEKRQSAAANDPTARARIDEELMALRREAMALWIDPPHPEPLRAAGSLEFSACSFDRGNAEIYANPDHYADFGPITGGLAEPAENGFVEYDVDFPVTAEYILYLRYAAGAARPVDVFLDGRKLGACCTGITFSSAPFEIPVRTTWSSRYARWETLYEWGVPLKTSITAGKHTLRLARGGPLPHVTALRLDSSTAFPEDWQPPERKVDLSRVPPRYRNVFLPPGAVNVATLRLAVQDAIGEFGPEYPDGQRWLKELAGLETKQNAAENGTPEGRQEIEDTLAALRSQAMTAHPAMKFDKLLFLKRPGGAHYGHTYNDQQGRTMGGNLCILSPVTPDGKVTKLVPELDGGLFDRFDLSFDAKRVVFSYKKTPEDAFRMYEIDLDPAAGKMIPGSLRQLTFGGPDEAEATQCDAIRGDRVFNDMDPCYLPNGQIMFTSTRAMQNVFCAAASGVSTLYVIDADGTNMRRLSQSPVNETAPSMMDDGRILYTRWEYVDKGLGNGAGLWAARPDGTGVEHIYKNNTTWPAGMASARVIPGSRQIVTIGGGHHYNAVGTVVLVDARRNRRTTEAMNCITPAVGYPHSMGYPRDTFGVFMDPYPFSEKFFLVAHRPGPKDNNNDKPKYGIYALDSWGNRTELCRDPEIDCFQPLPLLPRSRPPELASAAIADASQKQTGTLLIQDVYEGLPGIQRGRVKYVRVMGALSWPWSDKNGGVGPDVHRKRVYGVAEVHEDGSTQFAAPADENLFFQVLDENYMSLQHMATFINLMPGESRACIGCHEHRRKTPNLASARPLALARPVQKLVPQPGDTGPRMVHFEADVQPALDKHCVGCHGGEEAAGNLDLRCELTHNYSSSYDRLVFGGLVSYRDCRYGQSGFMAVPPLTHGSHRSKLAEQIRRDPCKANLTREEFIRIVTWIDANVPYYGTLRGERNLRDKDRPDFRPMPLVMERPGSRPE